MPIKAVISRALQLLTGTPSASQESAATDGGAPTEPATPHTLGSQVYRALADHLPVGLVVLGAVDGRVMRINPQAELELGLQPQQVLGQRLLDVVDAEAARQLAPALRRAVASREMVEESFDLTQGGRQRRVSARFLATYDAQGRADSLVVIARDVTAEQLAQRELVESRVRFQEFAAAIDEGMFVATPGWDRFDFVSPQALRCWGVTEAEIRADATCYLQRVHPDDLERMRAAARQAGGLAPIDLTVRIHHPTHGPRWLRMRSRAKALADGEHRVYGLVDDVTAEHAREAALEAALAEAEAASQAKSQFMANMSHEIRTPMNGILGMTELLLGTTLSDKQRRFAKAVYRSGEALLEIINDILDFSKIEAGKLELAPADFVLRGIVEDTLELLAPRAHEKGIELGFREGAGLPSLVRGDALRLRQVMTNLVANAIKFTESGEVVVELQGEARPGGLRLKFSVRDTGIGIDPASLPRLFSAFTQANGGMARRYGGTGLGLTISKQLVELMGGHITVESQPGQGSCFRFSVDVEAASPDAREPDEVLELPRMRVLVVDDHQTNRTVLDNLLGSWGMEVVLAQDGLEALQAVRGEGGTAGRFDLALVDMHMPRLDGLGLAKAIRDEHLQPGMKLILLSSVCMPDDVRSAQAVGFDRFIAKPLRRAELRQAIAGVVLPTKEPNRLTGSLAQQTILVVEDNGVNQEVIGQMLRQLGARVRMASSAMEGLRALSEARFDLVLMDIQMPGMDGTEALRWFRRGSGGRFQFKSAPDTPVVAVTANALGGDAERFIDLGFDDYLSKPFRQSQLHTMLKRHLALSPASTEDGVPSAPPAPAAAPGSGLPAELLALLDAQALARLQELDPAGRSGLLMRVLRTFEGSLSRLLQQMVEGRAAHDKQALRHVAHTLKSSSASVGALQLSRICADIERLVRLEETQNLEPLLDDMVAESNRVLAALKPALTP